MLISKQKEVEKRDDGTKIIRRQVGAFSIEELRKDPKTWLQILSPRGAYSKIQEEVDALRRSGPYSLRLTKDGLSIAPTRTLIVISGQFLKGLLPSLSLKFSGDLIQAASDAAEKKVLNRRKLFTAAASSVGIVLVTQILESIIKSSDDILDRRLGAKLEAEVLKVHLSLDLPTHEEENTKDLLRAANRITSFRPFTTLTRMVSLLASIIDLFSQVAVVRSLLGKNTRLLVALCATRPLLEILWTTSHSQYRMRMTDENGKRMTEMARIAKNPNLRKEVHLLGLSKWLLSEYTSASDRLGDTTLRPLGPEEQSERNLQLLGKLIDSSIYVIFALRAHRTPLMSLATLTLVHSTTSSMLGKVRNTFGESKQVSTSFSNIQSLYDSMNLKPKIQVEAPFRRYADEIKRKEKESAKAGMKIEFKDVTFTYPNSNSPALQSVSFTIQAGSTTVMVGINGSGKSTLVGLLTRLYDADSGSIFIDDHDIKTWDLQELRRHMSVLPQELTKFPLTISENLAIGSTLVAEGQSTSNVSPVAIQEALAAGGALEFVEKLPMKEKSRLIQGSKVREMSNVIGRTSNAFGFPQDEEIPVDLSLGQLQRLGVARAFIRNDAALHVFDEPDSSLDPKASANLFKRLQSLSKGERLEGEETEGMRRGSTTIFTTHKFTTTRKADQILVIENGSVLEDGTHHQLMQLQSGRYHELYSLQAAGFVDG